MGEREEVEARRMEAVAFIKRLVGAWDCCGTCAGGVLAVHDERVRASERERLAGEVEAG
jgi:hypothetical protein